MASIDDLMIEYREALAEAARLGPLADHEEHRRKVVLAEVAAGIGGAVAQAENRARASEQYARQLDVLLAANTAAEAAKARVTHLAARLEVWRSRVATQRERLKRGDGY